MIADVVLNEIQEEALPHEKPEDTHYVVQYEEDGVVKFNEFGPLPWSEFAITAFLKKRTGE
jgi:hypothetical protein